MRRRADWPVALAGWLEQARRRPFDWATHNCLSAACDAVLAMTGADPLSPWRSQYRTALEAMRIVRRNGGDLERFMRRLLGPPLADARCAGEGDVWLVALSEGRTAGVQASGAIWCASEDGMLCVRRARALRCSPVAWRI